MVIEEIEEDGSVKVPESLDEPAIVSSRVEEIDETTPEEEGPTMMELMMAAQKEAADAVNKEKVEKEKVDSSKAFSSSSGFKKGFFGGGEKKKKSTATTTTSTSTKRDDGIIDVTAKKGQATKDKKQTHSSLVMDEVQQAMRDDEHPMLKQLKSNGTTATTTIQATTLPDYFRLLIHP